jgi:hypothetical protein
MTSNFDYEISEIDMPPGAGASHFEAAIRKLEEETDYQRSSKGGVIDSRLHRGVKDAMDTQGYDWAETADSYMLAATFQIVRGFNRTIQIGYEPMSEMLRSGKRCHYVFSDPNEVPHTVSYHEDDEGRRIEVKRNGILGANNHIIENPDAELLEFLEDILTDLSQ